MAREQPSRVTIRDIGYGLDIRIRAPWDRQTTFDVVRFTALPVLLWWILGIPALSTLASNSHTLLSLLLLLMVAMLLTLTGYTILFHVWLMRGERIQVTASHVLLAGHPHSPFWRSVPLYEIAGLRAEVEEFEPRSTLHLAVGTICFEHEGSIYTFGIRLSQSEGEEIVRAIQARFGKYMRPQESNTP